MSSDDDCGCDLADEDPEFPTLESIIRRLTRSIVPEDYSASAYWNDRYSRDPSEYEWFQSWPDFFPFLRDIVATSGAALNVGCGSSPMPVALLELGFTRVLSVDVSDVVIAQMRARYADERRLEWRVMDCANIECDDASFDFVVDKGTIDALYCGSAAGEVVPKTLAEVARVLRGQCVFVCVSFAAPCARAMLTGADVGGMRFVKEVPVPNDRRDGEFFHCYVFRKGESLHM
jgi:SAM-dependent methyltransferase